MNKKLRYPKIVTPQANIDIVYKDGTNIQDKKILVLSLVNNCGKSIHYIERFVKELSEQFKSVKFSFFTNNNNDNTVSLLKDLSIRYNPDIQIIAHDNDIITKINRIYKFTTYRNLNFSRAIQFFGTDFDYIIVFDSDLSSAIPIKSIVDSLTIENKWSCISGNCCYDNSGYYYDELALRLLDDSLSIAEKNPSFYDYYGFSECWIESLYLFKDWVKAKSAFGGISIYPMSELLEIYNIYGYLYNINNLPPFTAEHISLNILLKNNILINPNIKYNNSVNLEGKMYYKPVAFVPRDAGFFSVFNFLVGGLTQGLRMYPLWNKEELIKMHRENNHFAYWTANSNCWFDYFEPLVFYPDDKTHTNDEYLKLSRYSGEQGPDEFRLPQKTKELLTGDKEQFKKWRKAVHPFFSAYIKLKSDILTEINNVWANNFPQGTNVIGVHYRHPSHFIESGKVYLEDYFTKIDKILEEQPLSKIFLASDSQFGIYSFIEKYGDKVVYLQDIDRISMSEFLHWSFSLADGRPDEVGFINGKGYELHHKRIKDENNNNKKMTIDLLKEVFLLSRCNHLINSISNIPLAISYINTEIEIHTL